MLSGELEEERGETGECNLKGAFGILKFKQILRM